VIFCDAGVAWYKDRDPVFWREDATGTKLGDLRMSYGVGFRFLLGPFRIRWDFAAPFDDYKPRPLKRWLGLFSLGVDF
jgi:outer membrane protein assembly factor BamA